MRVRPSYFEQVRQEVRAQGELLARVPKYAGAVRQMFNQVQRPDHVLSELLQNADDAGATEAAVHVKSGVFTFSHNGKDFDEEQFSSLCSFGASSKRILHTIGFRGIGFKSTFSLGDRVELITPSLSVAFHRDRFIEPEWVDCGFEGGPLTIVSVALSDDDRRSSILASLQDWLANPVPLLFFRSIQRLTIGDTEVHWEKICAGPTENSEWMRQNEVAGCQVMRARSAPEVFPEDAINEIRKECPLIEESDLEFPRFEIEIALGVKGALYAVLPTSVETTLPFAVNAPFVQDPARTGIKHPADSPTNRWLLKRAGAFAASLMLKQLEQDEASLEDRASAYELFPAAPDGANPLATSCASIVVQAFREKLSGRPFLLTEAGELKHHGESVMLPDALVDVWPAEEAAAHFDTKKRAPFTRHASADARERLLRSGVIDRVTDDDALNTLASKSLPKPSGWGSLLNLWTYVVYCLDAWRSSFEPVDLQIVPVQGEDLLRSAPDVVRVRRKELLESHEDWSFLARYLLVMDQDWDAFVTSKRSPPTEAEDAMLSDADRAALLLEKFGLERPSGVNTVLKRAADEFFRSGDVTVSNAVRLAHIAAKLGAKGGEALRFYTRDGRLKDAEGTLYDDDGTLEELLPDEMRDETLLHNDYTSRFQSCTLGEWREWTRSGQAGLHGFPPLIEVQSHYSRTREAFEAELCRRGFGDIPSYYYTSDKFTIHDWDFDERCWAHWQALADGNSNLWGRLVERMLDQPTAFWSESTEAKGMHIAKGGQSRAIAFPLVPAWILELRELLCLPDTYGVYRTPRELLLRTPETEPLLDVEPFVLGRLDKEDLRPFLELLGARCTPTGPDHLLVRIRALAHTANPPIAEVEMLYRRLDQLTGNGKTEDLETVREAFNTERLVLAEDGTWVEAGNVYLKANEDDVPGAAVVRSSVRHLNLWSSIGVEERPTADRAVEWLRRFASGQPVPQEDRRRVQALLRRHPERILTGCEHWLSLMGDWIPTGELRYMVGKESESWKHLDPGVKQKTADLRGLPPELLAEPPFSRLRALSAAVEYKLNGNPYHLGEPETLPWLKAFGETLQRVELETAEETERVRALARQLARTRWVVTHDIEVVPYIDGVPVGTPTVKEVAWLEETLWTNDLPEAKLARRVPEEIAAAFRPLDVTNALCYCFNRSANRVVGYLEESFILMPPEQLPVVAGTRGHTVDEDEASPEHEVSVSGAPPSVEPSDSKKIAPPLSRSVGGALEQELPEEDEGVSQGLVVEETTRVLHLQPRPERHIDIVERFAEAEGFRKVDEHRYVRGDGSSIGRTAGELFPWEQRTAEGTLARRYWSKNHCIEEAPLQLEAEIWWLIDRNPTLHALILLDPEGNPAEITGDRLCIMREEGRITLHPATYRLVYRHDEAA